MASPYDVTIIMAPQWHVGWPWPAPAYICEALRRKGYRVQFLDYNIRLHRLCTKLGYGHLWRDSSVGAWANGGLNFLAHLIDVEEIGGRVAGFSTTLTNRPFSLALAELVRQRFPDRKIIFGGHAVYSEEEVQGVPLSVADAICKGEGERTIGEVLTAGFDHLEAVPGLYLPGANGWRLTCERPVEANLDVVDSPTFEEIDLSEYEHRFLPIMASRGCIGRCIFCLDRLRTGCFRTRSAAHQLAELEYLTTHHDVEYFPYHDSLMNGDLDVLAEKTALLLRRGLKVSFGGNMMVRIDMPDDMFHDLRRSGMSVALVGVESGSRRVLRDMRKRHRPDMASTFTRKLHEAGIRTELNFMVGFPSETEADFEETLRWIRENRPNIDAIISATTFCMAPSELWDHLDEYQIVIEGPEPSHNWFAQGGANTLEVRQDRLRRLLELGAELGLIGADLWSDQNTWGNESIPTAVEFAARHANLLNDAAGLTADERREGRAALDRLNAAIRFNRRLSIGPCAVMRKTVASLRARGIRQTIRRGREWIQLRR